MDFFILWGISIVASSIMQNKAELNIYKEAADMGYKINIDKYLDYNKSKDKYGKLFKLFMFIPFANLMTSAYFLYFHKENDFDKVYDLHVNGVLEKMSDYENIEYMVDPTAKNAILVPKEYEEKLKNAFNIKVENENENWQIFFDCDKNLDNIDILKACGEAVNWTPKYQKEKVMSSLKLYVEAGIRRCGDLDSFMEELKLDCENDPSAEKDIILTDEKKDLENYVSEQTELLKKYKDELIQELTNLNELSNELAKCKEDIENIQRTKK